MKKILYSCDTGIDDALALTYLLGEEECQLLAVTVSFGMGSLYNVFRNTKKLLEAFNRTDIPLVMGSAYPLDGIEIDYAGGSRFHGIDGMGGIYKDEPEMDFGDNKPEDATDFIIDMINKYGKDLVWVTSGPVTDVARVLRKDPSICDKLGALYIMGGALACPGNNGPYTEAQIEANIRIDKLAAKEVLESKLPIVLVGLDVTRKTLLSYEDHERIGKIGTNSAMIIYNSLKHYLGAYNEFHPYLNGCSLHDPLAAAAAVHPEILHTIPMHLTCYIEGPMAGRTIENVLRCTDKEYTTQAAMFVDEEKFYKIFFTKVEKLLADN